MFNVSDALIAEMENVLSSSVTVDSFEEAEYCMDCSNRCAENCAANCHKSQDRK